ncbi:hypothetical protein P3G55_13885 [Leptospira sp. 96542]|nr:hypothetical protein [Leptospira sp. 96542]
MFQSRISVAIIMVFAAVISRILPHPPNFTPLLAVSLFSGAYLNDRRLAIGAPILAMIISDAFLGFHDLIPVVYAFMILAVLFGKKIQGSLTRSFGFTVVGSVLFFVTTNLAVWLTSGMYSLDLSGLSLCFTMAIPFFQNSIAGDLIYTGILFGSMSVLDAKVFVSKEKKQTI